MFCQACGENNTNAARFCNMCGESLARPGEAGGILEGGSTLEDQRRPNAYAAGGDSGYGGESMLSVSLAGIGVRSNKKTYVVISLIAITLIGVGAGLSWWLGGDPEVVADAGHAEPDDPFVIGSPLPLGAEVPSSDIDGVAGSMGTSMTGSTTSGSMGRDAPTGTPSMQTSMTSGTSDTSDMSTPSMSASSAGTSTGGSTTGGSTTGAMTAEMSSGSATAEPDPITAEMTNGTSMGTTGGTTPDPSDDPPERDIQMELYSSQVRFVIRRYYAARAQTCFDLATRNSPTVSGTVVVAMTIGADGAVSDTSVARNTTGNATLGRCLAGQVQTWRLPAPPGGSLEMQMPFSR